MKDFLLDMFLRGYEVLGVDKKRVEREVLVREARVKLKEFMEDFDVYSTIIGYFRHGQKAKIFLNDQTKKPLVKPDEILKFRFDQGNYRYLLMRVPLAYYQQQQPQLTQQQLIQHALQQQLGQQQQQQSQQDILRDYNILRHQPRPERGKVAGKSKYMPKSMKPPSKEDVDAKLDMCREMYKDKPIEDEE